MRSKPAGISADNLQFYNMSPTVRQATRMSAQQAFLDIESAHQQHVSSKARVNRDPWAAHGTRRTVGPQSGHATLNASDLTYTLAPPRSQHLQSLGPRPPSYLGALRPHLPHLHAWAPRGLASITTARLAPSHSTPSTTTSSTPTTIFARLLMRTPRPLLRDLRFATDNPSGKVACHQPLHRNLTHA